MADVQYHINVKAGDIGKYCILPGDPDRCELIAKYLDDPYFVSRNREYTVWNGYLEGELVSVCSTGIGGPSAAIAAEELYACGARCMIRVGTCGGISLDVRAGDIVIASGAVRQDGTSREYAPLEFPAVPNTEVLFSLCAAAKELGLPHHAGVIQSKDSFYGQHSPSRMATEAELKQKWLAWKRLGVLASEMECATLFTVCATLGIQSGAAFLCLWNQERREAGIDTLCDECHDTSGVIRTAIEAIRKMILK